MNSLVVCLFVCLLLYTNYYRIMCYINNQNIYHIKVFRSQSKQQQYSNAFSRQFYLINQNALFVWYKCEEWRIFASNSERCQVIT